MSQQRTNEKAVHLHHISQATNKVDAIQQQILSGVDCKNSQAFLAASQQLFPEHPKDVSERDDPGEPAVVLLVEHPQVAHTVRERLHHDGD